LYGVLRILPLLLLPYPSPLTHTAPSGPLTLSLLLRPPPISTLFPYTTLFRSISGRLVADSSTTPSPGSNPSSSDSNWFRVCSRSSLPPCTLAAPRARPSASSSSMKRSEEHTSELQSRENLVCRLLLEKKKRET